MQEGSIPYTSPFVSFCEAISILAERLEALDDWPRHATDRDKAEREVPELEDRLRRASGMAESMQSVAAARHHSVTAKKLAEAEKRLALLREAGAPSTPGSLEEAENELLSALYDGAVFAIGDITTANGAPQAVQIPSAAWGPGAQIERLVSALTPPAGGATYLNVRHPLTDLHKIWPELQPQPEHVVTPRASQTGLPGRPTSWHLIEAECRKRYAAGERHPRESGDENRAEWARTLINWLGLNHEGAPIPTEKTVVNKLGEVLRELAGNNLPKLS